MKRGIILDRDGVLIDFVRDHERGIVTPAFHPDHVRLLPGVLNDETSALFDSFQDNLLSYPVYTRPATFRDWTVPEILLTGNTRKIEEWRHEQAIKRTRQRRPDLLNDDE